MKRAILLVLLLMAALPAHVVAQEKPTCLGREATIVGTEGDDVIYTRRVTNVDPRPIVNGLGGNDRIVGARGRDILCGGAGDDTITGEGGWNRIAPGPGDDTIYADSFTIIHYTESASPVEVNAAEGTATGEGTDSFIGDPGSIFGSKFDDSIISSDSITRVIGGDAGNDRIIGSDNGGTFKGGPGNDTIETGSEGDWIQASSGDDHVDAGEGDDYIDGGSGTDTCANGEENLNCEA